MNYSNNEFGNYLRELIKKKGMTQSNFYTQLQIKKPYFYDILSGKSNPPPYDKQIKASEILCLTENEKLKFFDVAARERAELPADILKATKDKPLLIKSIRNLLKNEIVKEEKKNG